MGRSIIEVLDRTDGLCLTCAYDRPGSSQIGENVSQDVALSDSSDIEPGRFDVLIDFSVPEAALFALEVCAGHGKGVVTGVTGFSGKQRRRIESLSANAAIVAAPNMSLGVNLCFGLVAKAAAVLGSGADIDVSEAHHRHKRDAPSGTALKMGDVIAKSLDADPESVEIYDAGTGKPRPPGSIGFHVVRAGDVTGEHTITFTLDGEQVEISHKALSRLAFARGAVRAALWVKDKPAGLYDMQAVLNL